MRTWKDLGASSSRERVETLLESALESISPDL